MLLAHPVYSNRIEIEILYSRSIFDESIALAVSGFSICSVVECHVTCDAEPAGNKSLLFLSFFG